MKHIDELKKILTRINGKGYKAYKDIQGSYDVGNYVLNIEHVQGDPYAAPSRISVHVPMSLAGFPEDTFKNRSREIALRDFITRCFHRATQDTGGKARGTGKSGIIAIDSPGQEILERTSIFVSPAQVEARFTMGLPAFGRKIAGTHAIEMFFRELPDIISQSLIFENLDISSLYIHIDTAEDADFLRDDLARSGLIGFVYDGAVLPRKSGIDSRPMNVDRVIPFISPESLRSHFTLPNRGKISGMGIPQGVTLIVGGGYHGKSTLLNALELGIYNHVPGDGREYVVTRNDAVKIRAEDGRSIERTCITPFISNLPFGQDTDAFSTEDASGSTSQAANIIEAIEAGAGVLLIDEDTSATNFMIRDHRMQELVSKDNEPITPFIDRVHQIYTDRGVSTVLVIGGSGDYFDVADLVICMTEYRPGNVTDESKEIAARHVAERTRENDGPFGNTRDRIPLPESFDASRGKREVKISSKGLHSILYGSHHIDLGAVEQLVDISQTRSIGDAIHYATRFMDGNRTLREVVDTVLQYIESRGLDLLGPWPAGDYAAFRGIELACAINRLRTLRVIQKK